MADLNIVLLFCVLYSGVVISSLWITLGGKSQEMLVHSRKEKSV